ncbi:MAG TPA: BREX system P-loop protein BrxC, partial [Treponemataceae bacterium]|nr:BREX system P-loop protein BrxC [Treponemataceae bacterium]
MEEALLARNDTKHADQLAAAFGRLRSVIDPMAVIFDIGTMAKNNEVIPYTTYRQVLARLGYSNLDGVAHYELALEDEGKYAEFLECYKAKYGIDWSEKKSGGLAAQHFRAVYREIFPDHGDLLDVATFKCSGLDVKTMVDNILRALDRRAPGKTLFIVVDEVSQYITSQEDSSKVNLQSFISEIGSRAKAGSCRIWFLATGQEKLEDESKSSALFKLQDRFPPALRVHLDRANVGEVVERRLLRKKGGSELEALVTSANLDLLKLNAWGCEQLTREALITDYPLLPEHIPLFMDITQSLRNSSARSQSDSGGVRSVLNNIWSLFNEDPVALKNRPVGTLLTLDMLFDMIGSSVDSDVLLTLHRLFEKTPPDSMERKVAKAIALLEMNGDNRPVTDEALAKLLYPALGSRGVKNEVEAALKTLKDENWIQYSEKTGWSVQNNAAQEWNRQKNEISVSAGEIDEFLRELAASIVEPVAQPVFPRLGVRFPLACFWGSDNPEDRISGRGEPTAVSVCFHWAANQAKRDNKEIWLDASRDKKAMIHWVSGDTSSLESIARDWKKSQKMIARYRGQSGLTPVQSRLLVMEQGNADAKREALKKDLRTVWTEGCLYFDGGREEARAAGTSFESILKTACETRIERIYNAFEPGNVHLTIADFDQLLKKDTGGLSRVFLDGAGALGLARSDGGKIVIKPDGAVPQAIYAYLKEKTFDLGERVFAEFAGPPYGWSRLVIKSAVVALLRDEKIKFDAITAITDPDARKIFESDREFARSEIEVRVIGDDDLTGRDRNAIKGFFEDVMHLPNADNSAETLADLVFQKFPHIKDQIGAIERTLTRFGLTLPLPIVDLNSALTDCLSSRLADTALRRVKAKLPVLVAGYPQLTHAAGSLSESTVRELTALKQCLDVEAAQLAEIDEADGTRDDAEAIRAQFAQSEPWKGYADVKPSMEAIKTRYRATRERLAREEREAQDQVLSAIKARADFALLERDAQDEILGIVTETYRDIDMDAVEPRLVSLSRLPVQLREAGDRAQRRFDQIVNERDRAKRVRAVRSGLRNRTFASEAELDEAIADLREKCRDAFAAGDTVRFEE